MNDIRHAKHRIIIRVCHAGIIIEFIKDRIKHIDPKIQEPDQTALIYAQLLNA